MERGLRVPSVLVLLMICHACPLACSSKLHVGTNSADASAGGKSGVETSTPAQAGGTGGIQVSTPAQAGGTGGVQASTPAQVGDAIEATCPLSDGGDVANWAACSDTGLATFTNNDAGAGACPCTIFVDATEVIRDQTGTPCNQLGLDCHYGNGVYECSCSMGPDGCSTWACGYASAASPP